MNKIHKITNLCIFFTLLLSACSAPYEKEANEVTSNAGSNRAELEKVLNHYRESGDNDKYEAACYLIANMRDLLTLDTASTANGRRYFQALANVRKAQGCKKLARDSVYFVIDSVMHTTPAATNCDTPKYIADASTISSQTLIDDIELAFQAWREMPWSRNVSKDDFLEYVLPYRCSETYSTTARKFFWNRYHGIADSLKDENNLQKIASIVLADIDSWITEDPALASNLPQLASASLDDCLLGRVGTCANVTEVKITALRAIGIPVAYDYLVNWGSSNNGHSWLKIIDNEQLNDSDKIDNQQVPGNTQHIITGSSYDEFPLFENLPKGVNVAYKRTVPKVYRSTYAWHKPDDNAADDTGGSHTADVTSEYVATADVRYPLPRPVSNAATCQLLCFDNSDWVPVCSGKIVDGGHKAEFKAIGKNIVYLPMMSFRGKETVMGAPFEVKNDGSVRILQPQKATHTVTARLKYPFRTHVELWLSFVRGAKVWFSNSPTGDGAKSAIATIKKIPFYCDSLAITVPKGQTFRYLTYDFSSVDSIVMRRHDIAEISLHDTHGKANALTWASGNPGTYGHEAATALTDGDMVSYFEDNTRNPCQQLTFKAARPIISGRHTVAYAGRNDGNAVIPSCGYTLSIWTDNGWKQIGHTTARADGTATFAGVPQGALLLMRCDNGGTENRIFTFENGKQIFH